MSDALVPPVESAHLQWRLIETARKDGTFILVDYAEASCGPYLVQWGKEWWGWNWLDAGGHVVPKPTHWMPAPRLSAPCAPAVITLDENDARQVEAAATAVARSQGCISDGGFWTVKMCMEQDECLCRRRAVAVIRALKEVKP